jgi:hypothetical protein
MAYSASVSTADNIFIYNPKSFTFSNDSNKAEKIVDELKSDIGFAESATAFIYNNRIRFNIGVSSNAKRFALLRGLIEFHRPKNFLFTYDTDAKQIEADVREVDYTAFLNFLVSVNQWLKNEVDFKAALRNVIEFEKKYRSEGAAVYAALIK